MHRNDSVNGHAGLLALMVWGRTWFSWLIFLKQINWEACVSLYEDVSCICNSQRPMLWNDIRDLGACLIKNGISSHPWIILSLAYSPSPFCCAVNCALYMAFSHLWCDWMLAIFYPCFGKYCVIKHLYNTLKAIQHAWMCEEMRMACLFLCLCCLTHVLN